MSDYFSGEVTWVHYLGCALLFVLAGLICGYFIWRKGNMQTQDAEIEVRRTEEELKRLRDDLSREEKLIRPEDEDVAIEALIDESTKP